MRQCDYCGNYGDDVSPRWIECYHGDGSGDEVNLCEDHIEHLAEIYPCEDQAYNDMMQANEADLAEHINDEPELGPGDDH